MNNRKKDGGLRIKGLLKSSSPDLPLISIITVVLNSATHLEYAIRSVIEQDYNNIEYIIIDGGSKDGTLDIINKYENQIDYWLSEPDLGIYDAMNKGIERAHGAWLYFLGADDVLYAPNIIVQFARCFASDVSVVFGDICYPDGRKVRSSLGPRTLLHNTMHHQGAFYNSRLFDDWRYDNRLKIVADYELNLLIYLRREKHVRYDETVAKCDDRGVSQTLLDTMQAETDSVRGRHVAPLLNRVLRLIFSIEFRLFRLVLSLKSRRFD